MKEITIKALDQVVGIKFKRDVLADVVYDAIDTHAAGIISKSIDYVDEPTQTADLTVPCMAAGKSLRDMSHDEINSMVTSGLRLEVKNAATSDTASPMDLIGNGPLIQIGTKNAAETSMVGLIR